VIDRKMIDGLCHEYAGMGDDKFFTAIDAAGGWPLGYKFVGFEHTERRAAGFCNSPYNDGYWTVIATADDYYLWKLSPAALQRIVNSVRDAISLSTVNARNLRISNSSGYRAALAKEPQS
jgi:hypothetical protein